jgi:hypothetical protein
VKYLTSKIYQKRKTCLFFFGNACFITVNARETRGVGWISLISDNGFLTAGENAKACVLRKRWFFETIIGDPARFSLSQCVP